MKKNVITAILGVMMVVVLTITSYGEEIVSEKNGLDVMFVIDASGSMKTNDKNGIGLEMVKAFVDTVHIEKIRIGFVAYNDKIVSSTSPVSVSTQSERENLKAALNSIVYSGNTDMGLGLSYAHGLTVREENRDRIMVLISDGESDLPNNGEGRTLEQSNADMETTIQTCQGEAVPIYTIAFGKYEGNQAVLQQISANTGAMTYAVQSPQALIEVLYGIFGNNLSYKIQEVTDSVYAEGEQEIRYLLDEKYLDELDLLLISPKTIGNTSISYGGEEVGTVSHTYYAVGKLNEISDGTREITVRTGTAQGQALKAYLISYRSLVPVLNLPETGERNERISYEVYFKDRAGNTVVDESFYEKFQWTLNQESDSAGIKDGVIKGELRFSKSGRYKIEGQLSDNLGTYPFSAELAVANTPPWGSLPEESYTIWSPERDLDLNQYFQDSNNDRLTFLLEPGSSEGAQVSLSGSHLVIKAKKAGVHSITIFVSDGEDTFAYPHRIKIIPLWQKYWWCIGIGAVLLMATLWKILYKPKPELVQIAEKKAQNRFCGKLDAYITKQPENREDIPPLTFPMYKMKANKVSLAQLMQSYPEAADDLGLDQIYLIPDEERRMVLYHTSDGLIMIGNSIACRQIPYSIGFGDVIYITSPKDTYELEVHYIAMIQ